MGMVYYVHPIILYNLRAGGPAVRFLVTLAAAGSSGAGICGGCGSGTGDTFEMDERK